MILQLLHYCNFILILLLAPFALSLRQNEASCMLGHFAFTACVNRVRSAFVCSGRIPKKICRHHFCDTTGNASLDKSEMSRNNAKNKLSSKPSIELEVEQKFALLLDESSIPIIEEKLTSMGFQPKQGSSSGFVDTYFDVPHWKLSLNDRWLRYRQITAPDPNTKVSGAWQLKRRPPSPQQDFNTESTFPLSKTTVYEELEGDEAIQSTLDFLSSILLVEEEAIDEKEQLQQFSSTTIVTPLVFKTSPSFPLKYQETAEKFMLQPFAQFETIRSSWKSLGHDQKHNLSVDLDVTDFGHMVGEVEAIVHRKEDVNEVINQIEKLIEILTTQISNDDDDGREMPPIRGKLETYLTKFNPDHLKACVQAGIL